MLPAPITPLVCEEWTAPLYLILLETSLPVSMHMLTYRNLYMSYKTHVHNCIANRNIHQLFPIAHDTGFILELVIG